MTAKARIKLGERVAIIGLVLGMVGTAAGGVFSYGSLSKAVRVVEVRVQENATRSIETARKQAGTDAKLEAIHEDVRLLIKHVMDD